MNSKLKALGLPWACALAALVSVLITNPRAELGINDDWSYIFTAKRLAETGHIFYNGWGAPILGPQLYLGAAFIRLFGFSYTATRASSDCIFVLCAALAYTVMARAGIRPRNAVLGTLTLVLSPLFLPIATTFMSDNFAMFFFLLFLYGCLRSEGAATDGSRTLWLVLATTSGLAAGSVRQIFFPSAVLALPCLAVYHRRNPRRAAICLALAGFSLIAAYLLVHWFNRQPYTITEPFYYVPHTGTEWRFLLTNPVRSAMSLTLLLSPVLFAIAVKAPFRQWRKASVFFVGLLAVVALASQPSGGVYMARWLLIGHYVSILGGVWRPLLHVLGPAVWALPVRAVPFLALCILTLAALAAWAIWTARKDRISAPPGVNDEVLLWICVPFTLGYLLLVFTRLLVYDRYFLPIIFIACLGLLRWYERWYGKPVTGFAFLPLAVLAVFGIAGTHDMFTAVRAVQAATQKLRDAGVPRDEIHDGWAFDGWTEIENTGYVNEPRLHPSSLYRPQAGAMHGAKILPDGQSDLTCYQPFAPYTPSIHARFILQLAPNYCYPDSSFAPIRFKTWLSPHENAIYIANLPQDAR